MIFICIYIKKTGTPANAGDKKGVKGKRIKLKDLHPDEAKTHIVAPVRAREPVTGGRTHPPR